MPEHSAQNGLSSHFQYFLLIWRKIKQDAQLSQRDRAAVNMQGALVLAKSGRLELGDNILQTL